MQLADILKLAAHKGMSRFYEKRAGVALPIAIGASIPGIVSRAIERDVGIEEQLNRDMPVAGMPARLASYQGTEKAAAGEGAALVRYTPKPGFGMGMDAGQGGSGASDLFNMAGMAGKALGLGHILGAPGEALGEMLKHKIMGTPFGAQKDPLHMGATSAITAAGSELGKGVVGIPLEMLKRKIFAPEFGEQKDPMHMGASKAIEAFGSEIGKSSAGLLRDIANKAINAVDHIGDNAARQAILGDLKKSDSVLANSDNRTLLDAYHTMTRFAPTLSTDKNAVRSFLRQAVMAGSGPDYMSIKLLADAERAVTGEKDKR